MTIWDVVLATFVVISGLSIEVIGETNCFHISSVSQNILGEQFVEWTVFNQYESGQTISRTLEERGTSYLVTLEDRAVGSVGGVEIYVENAETHAKDQLFIPSH